MRRPLVEIAMVILTGGLFLIFENLLHLKLQFLIPCTLFWIGYLVWRVRRDPSELREWGLRTDNLKRAAIPAVVFFVVAASGMAIFRVVRGWHPLPATAVVVLAVYPVWGFIQQFVVQALIAGNLRKLGVGPAIVIPVASMLFGLAHLPDWPLVGLCAGAGVVWTVLYLRNRNLIPLAVCHAWLGTLVYYWLLERNPWLEMFPG